MGFRIPRAVVLTSVTYRCATNDSGGGDTNVELRKNGEHRHRVGVTLTGAARHQRHRHRNLVLSAGRHPHGLRFRLSGTARSARDWWQTSTGRDLTTPVRPYGVDQTSGRG